MNNLTSKLYNFYSKTKKFVEDATTPLIGTCVSDTTNFHYFNNFNQACRKEILKLKDSEIKTKLLHFFHNETNHVDTYFNIIQFCPIEVLDVISEYVLGEKYQV